MIDFYLPHSTMICLVLQRHSKLAASEMCEEDCMLFTYMYVIACITRGSYGGMLLKKDLKLDVPKLLVRPFWDLSTTTKVGEVAKKFGMSKCGSSH